jgi:hypothetical protein
MTSARLLGAGRSRYRLDARCVTVMQITSRQAVDWALAVRPSSTNVCVCMHDSLKVISLSLSFRSHACNRYTNRAAGEYPRMLVDNARAPVRAHEPELFAARLGRSAASRQRSASGSCSVDQRPPQVITTCFGKMSLSSSEHCFRGLMLPNRTATSLQSSLACWTRTW